MSKDKNASVVTKSWQAVTMIDKTTDEVRERVIARDCEQCGRRFEVSPLGRRPRYCGQTCRQRAWELRRARTDLQREEPARPEVVREVIERTVSPGTGREWAQLFGELAATLRDPSTLLAKRHYDHARIYRALIDAAEALAQATPGGLAALTTHR